MGRDTGAGSHGKGAKWREKAARGGSPAVQLLERGFPGHSTQEITNSCGRERIKGAALGSWGRGEPAGKPGFVLF